MAKDAGDGDARQTDGAVVTRDRPVHFNAADAGGEGDPEPAFAVLADMDDGVGGEAAVLVDEAGEVALPVDNGEAALEAPEGETVVSQPGTAVHDVLGQVGGCLRGKGGQRLAGEEPQPLLHGGDDEASVAPVGEQARTGLLEERSLADLNQLLAVEAVEAVIEVLDVNGGAAPEPVNHFLCIEMPDTGLPLVPADHAPAGEEEEAFRGGRHVPDFPEVLPFLLRQVRDEGTEDPVARAVGFNEPDGVDPAHGEPVALKGGDAVEETASRDRNPAPAFAVPCQDGSVIGDVDDAVGPLDGLEDLAVPVVDMGRVVDHAREAAFRDVRREGETRQERGCREAQEGAKEGAPAVESGNRHHPFKIAGSAGPRHPPRGVGGHTPMGVFPGLTDFDKLCSWNI